MPRPNERFRALPPYPLAEMKVIRRRIEAHDGTLVVTSPPGGPTTLTAELPCGS